ncbi:phasin family protein [Methylobacterium planeticum]|uniref:Phasin family protein n=1 Tax=Methylobacterium planeticum TaxID=2615211 RepID=A0A6N6MQI4_9HYPH|nr:phasin family protein [Methylobacterium planeticum]KAB1073368.1 phasin family protein [Methylobacterium planeticum]
MSNSLETTEAALKTGMSAVMQSVGAASKTTQTIGIEMVDFAKQSFEDTVATAEKLTKAGSLGKAVEVQTAYVKGSYERSLAQAATLRDLYVALARDLAKPFAGLTSKVA